MAFPLFNYTYYSIVFNTIIIVPIAVGCLSAENVHALRKCRYINIRLRSLHHTLSVDGVNLCLQKSSYFHYIVLDNLACHQPLSSHFGKWNVNKTLNLLLFFFYLNNPFALFLFY